MTGGPGCSREQIASIDEIASFYEMLGFEITYRQTRPNWIRIYTAAQAAEARTKLARALENAARQADARGDERQGLKILEGALKRATGDEPELPAAREYRDELVERIKGS
ncbi:hypothetical protein [Amycolatopsis solani]|uniref:hypothetical protein n=1 Tax=Amycolatopsis solani TaxID=3028615 RepID=UPI00296F3353|nr:hypothetical protein [Amycolatopsis sp. MEP2-6]